jgi:hypothetical protein
LKLLDGRCAELVLLGQLGPRDLVAFIQVGAGVRAGGVFLDQREHESDSALGGGDRKGSQLGEHLLEEFLIAREHAESEAAQFLVGVQAREDGLLLGQQLLVLSL